ncbi:MAG: HAMP domain-containing sensor histidine kinase [Ktedonobacterales bacterium]
MSDSSVLPNGASLQPPQPPRSGHSWLFRRVVSPIFIEPFLPDPAAVLRLSNAEREALRRATLLRLILVSLLIAETLIVIPAAFLALQVPIFIGSVLGSMGAALVSLYLNHRRHTDAAAIVFLGVALALLFNFGWHNPAGVDVVVVVIYASAVILIFLNGLVLPQWAVWPFTLLLLALTLITLLALPSLAHITSPFGATQRLSIAAMLAAFELVIAVITMVASQSANAGVVAATRAAATERDLASLKDQFIIDANHELRTPIMALYGNIELIRLLGDKADNAQRDLLINRALRSGDAVIRLLGNVLDTGVLDAANPKIRLRPIVVRQMLLAALDSFDPREIGEPALEINPAKLRDITVVAPEELVVMADEGRMRQILLNLISNAMKYSDDGSPIQITAQSLPAAPRGAFARLLPGEDREARGDAQVRISVRDFGLGVPTGDIPKLFNRFVRLERDIAGPVRGTGIGLFVSRSLAEAMGGRIWVESSGVPGEGSTFSFTLPQIVPAEPPERSGGSGKLRIVRMSAS